RGGAALSRKQLESLTEVAKSEGAGGLAYISHENDEAKSLIAKFLSATELAAGAARTEAEKGDEIFSRADKRSTVNKELRRLRSEFADHFQLKDPSVIALAWIVDFPFYEWDESRQRVDFGHNPFTMPLGGLEALQAAETDEQKLSIAADQYDMVMNGYEICS